MEVNTLLQQHGHAPPPSTTGAAAAAVASTSGLSSRASTSSGLPLPFQDEEFKLSHVLNSNIIHFKEEIEEICDGADKQLQIEKRLYEV